MLGFYYNMDCRGLRPRNNDGASSLRAKRGNLRFPMPVYMLIAASFTLFTPRNDGGAFNDGVFIIFYTFMQNYVIIII